MIEIRAPRVEVSVNTYCSVWGAQSPLSFSHPSAITGPISTLSASNECCFLLRSLIQHEHEFAGSGRILLMYFSIPGKGRGDDYL